MDTRVSMWKGHISYRSGDLEAFGRNGAEAYEVGDDACP